MKNAAGFLWMMVSLPLSIMGYAFAVSFVFGWVPKRAPFFTGAASGLVAALAFRAMFTLSSLGLFGGAFLALIPIPVVVLSTSKLLGLRMPIATYLFAYLLLTVGLMFDDVILDFYLEG